MIGPSHIRGTLGIPASSTILDDLLPWHTGQKRWQLPGCILAHDLIASKACAMMHFANLGCALGSRDRVGVNRLMRRVDVSTEPSMTGFLSSARCKCPISSDLNFRILLLAIKLTLLLETITITVVIMYTRW
jgi:hypothetical protein